mgnify:CR=1 FL=1
MAIFSGSTDNRDQKALTIRRLERPLRSDCWRGTVQSESVVAASDTYFAPKVGAIGKHIPIAVPASGFAPVIGFAERQRDFLLGALFGQFGVRGFRVHAGDDAHATVGDHKLKHPGFRPVTYHTGGDGRAVLPDVVGQFQKTPREL